MSYGNQQSSIEAEATAKKRLEIAAKNLKSDKLATVEPWKTSLPEGVELVRLDNSFLSLSLKASSMVKFTMDDLKRIRIREYIEERELVIARDDKGDVIRDHDGIPRYYREAGTDPEGKPVYEEFRLPPYVSQTFIGIENYISMCIAQLASPAAQRASAAMLGAETRTEQPQVQIVNGGGEEDGRKR